MLPEPVETVSSTWPLTERLRSKVASEDSAGSAASVRTAIAAANRCFIMFLDSIAMQVLLTAFSVPSLQSSVGLGKTKPGENRAGVWARLKEENSTQKKEQAVCQMQYLRQIQSILQFCLKGSGSDCAPSVRY